MNTRKILIGCNEPLVVEAIRAMLATPDQGDTVLEFSESNRCDDFIQQACNGDFGLAVIYPNCLFPTAPFTLLEHSVLAINTIKAASAVPVIALTSMAEWSSPLRAAGADICLETPFHAAQLRDAVSSCLSVDGRG